MTARPRTGAGLRRDSGTVFVESIIAAAIVAMALGSTYRVIADSAARDRAAETRRTALLIAQSELATVGSEIPLAAGDAAGVVGDLVWRVRVSRFAEGQDSSAAGGLWQVSVRVAPRVGGRDLARLDTLRLGPQA